MSNVFIAFPHNEESRPMVDVIVADNPAAVVNHPPGLVKIDVPGSLTIRRETSLGWETSYQPMDKVFPYDKYEGIKIHDWSNWGDPFRLTMDAYWKYQGEKEKKLYAVIEVFAQNDGQLGTADARYVTALKLFIQGVTPLVYCAHRGFAHVGRQFTGEGARVAAQMQSIDELRHHQTETHAVSPTSTSTAC